MGGVLNLACLPGMGISPKDDGAVRLKDSEAGMGQAPHEGRAARTREAVGRGEARPVGGARGAAKALGQGRSRPLANGTRGGMAGWVKTACP
jgi:hypothetical protein